MTVYQMDVKSYGLTASYLFKLPPARAEIIVLFTNIWRRLKPETQDEMWNFLLLAYSCPEVTWTGTFENIYGQLTIKPVGVIEDVATYQSKIGIE